MRFGSLFAGIGGMDLGLERAGLTCAWQVEWDEWCRRILAKHWPDVRRFGDITQLSGYELEPVDLVCGGFPCQPVSNAGARKAQSDDRWLWPEYARLLRLLRPRFALLENVPGLLNVNSGTAFGEVLGDLAALGYDAEWHCIPAGAVGAHHVRDRVFVLAHANGLGFVGGQPRTPQVSRVGNGSRLDVGAAGAPLADAPGSGLEGWLEPEAAREALTEFARRNGEPGGIWAAEPGVDRVVDGVPHWVDRIKGLGNAVVPHTAEFIGRQLMEVA